MAEPAQRKGLELIYHIHQSCRTDLLGDPVRLRQIILNLVGNAIKFTAQGHVSVLINTLTETAKTVSLQFRVPDTGEGIPLATQQRLFQAFSQADGSTTRRFGGTGLGLAICKHLTELMRGAPSGSRASRDKGPHFGSRPSLRNNPSCRILPLRRCRTYADSAS